MTGNATSTDERQIFSPRLVRLFLTAAGLLVIWGVALWLYNSLFFKFCHFFALTPALIALTQSSFHLAYIGLAGPAVLFHQRFGFKFGVLAGLSVFSFAAFLVYLAIVQHSTFYFFVSVLMIGCCGAWLDTSLNPLVALAGSRKTLILRLNWAHAFNGVGLFLGYFIAVSLLGPDYQLTWNTPAQTSAHPYVLVGLGAILLAFLVEQISLPALVSRGSARTVACRPAIAGLLADKALLRSALALGAYCIVLTVLWTANYKYHHAEIPGHQLALYERGWLWFALGRMIIPVVLHFVAPMRLMMGSAALCMIAIAVAGIIGGHIGWICLIAASLFLAMTYPTIFGTGLSHAGEALGWASGLLIIAAGSGNLLSSLASILALDAFAISPRLVVLAALPFEAFVLYFAWKAVRR